MGTGIGLTKKKIITSLGEFVDEQYQQAKDFRETNGINARLTKSVEQYNGIYSADIQAAINEMGGTDVYRRITASKCNTLVSWLNDILLDTNDHFWEYQPTPIPDIPEDMKAEIVGMSEQKTMQEYEMSGGQMTPEDAERFAYAKSKEMRAVMIEKIRLAAAEKAKGMTRQVSDQLVDGQYNDCLYDFFYNYSIYPSAFMKGPLIRIEKKLEWADGTVEAREKPILKWYTPSPFDIYPTADANTVQQGRLFETVRYTREELYLLRNVPNYNKSAISRLLQEYKAPTENHDDYIEDDREINENKESKYTTYQNTRTKFEGVEMWGCVPGYLLKQFGVKVDEIERSYEAHIIKIAEEVILATLNEDPLNRRPYYMASFQHVPGSFWGISLPESMEDIQRECNAAIRALCNNLSISSGPLVAYDLAQLPPDEQITKLYPWKIFTFDGTRSFNTRKAIEFFQPNSNVNELLNGYNSFRQEADNETNIPSFASGGTQVSGAGETASGLSILQGNLTKGIKNHVMNISTSVIYPALENMYYWNMLYNPDEDIKGDVQVVVRGPLKVTTKEQKQLRLNEFLQVTNNPTDQQIIGPKRRANLLREQAKMLDVPAEEAVPTKEEMEITEQIPPQGGQDFGEESTQGGTVDESV